MGWIFHFKLSSFAVLKETQGTQAPLPKVENSVQVLFHNLKFFFLSLPEIGSEPRIFYNIFNWFLLYFTTKLLQTRVCPRWSNLIWPNLGPLFNFSWRWKFSLFFEKNWKISWFDFFQHLVKMCDIKFRQQIWQSSILCNLQVKTQAAVIMILI